MILKKVDNGTGAFIFVMEGEPHTSMPVNGRWFHRSHAEAVANAAAIGLVVYLDGWVITDGQHHELHKGHAGTQVGHDGVNVCQSQDCPHPRYFNMVGRGSLDRLLS